MKVFISWSGKLSHEVACELREWLPNVLQYVEPYVSSEDIDKGSRWSVDIAKELEQSYYGILIITKDNSDAAWINFEAGALSKMLETSKVSPFLFNLKRSDLEAHSPLTQFQSTIYEKEDVYKLIIGMNKHANSEHQLAEERLKKSFEVWWTELNTALEKILKTPVSKTEKASPLKDETPEILEELLYLVRNQQRILTTPQELIPTDYLRFALEKSYEGFYRTPRSMDEVLALLRHAIDMNKDLNRILQLKLAKSPPQFSEEEIGYVTTLNMEISDGLTFVHDLIKRNRT